MKRFLTSFLFICLIFFAAPLTKAFDFVFPEPLQPGDKIAIVAPASAAASQKVLEASEAIRERGYEPIIMPHACGCDYGTFGATDADRAADIMDAFADPEIKAIIAARGGYGCVRILDMLDPIVISGNPKWLIGFSDISALHAYLSTFGMASIHGVVLSHFRNYNDDEASTHLFDILEKGLPITYDLAPDPLNMPGTARGRLIGGNLMVINELAQTPYDILNGDLDNGAILFIEDVGERLHSLERVLFRLHMSGVLDRINGLVVGTFSDCTSFDDFPSVKAMISYWLRKWGYEGRLTVAFGFPVGHIKRNFPMVEGSMATLEVTPQGVTFTQSEN